MLLLFFACDSVYLSDLISDLGSDLESTLHRTLDVVLGLLRCSLDLAPIWLSSLFSTLLFDIPHGLFSHHTLTIDDRCNDMRMDRMT